MFKAKKTIMYIDVKGVDDGLYGGFDSRMTHNRAREPDI